MGNLLTKMMHVIYPLPFQRKILQDFEASVKLCPLNRKNRREIERNLCI